MISLFAFGEKNHRIFANRIRKFLENDTLSDDNLRTDKMFKQIISFCLLS